MSISRISEKDDLNEKELEMLNDIMYVMGLQAGANLGLISRKRVSEESKKLNEKYRDMKEEIEELNRKIDKKFFER